jgi:hypothetical protein
LANSRFCAKCGAQVGENTKFCGLCGNALGIATKANDPSRHYSWDLQGNKFDWNNLQRTKDTSVPPTSSSPPPSYPRAPPANNGAGKRKSGHLSKSKIGAIVAVVLISIIIIGAAASEYLGPSHSDLPPSSATSNPSIASSITSSASPLCSSSNNILAGSSYQLSVANVYSMPQVNKIVGTPEIFAIDASYQGSSSWEVYPSNFVLFTNTQDAPPILATSEEVLAQDGSTPSSYILSSGQCFLLKIEFNLQAGETPGTIRYYFAGYSQSGQNIAINNIPASAPLSIITSTSVVFSDPLQMATLSSYPTLLPQNMSSVLDASVLCQNNYFPTFSPICDFIPSSILHVGLNISPTGIGSPVPIEINSLSIPSSSEFSLLETIGKLPFAAQQAEFDYTGGNINLTIQTSNTPYSGPIPLSVNASYGGMAVSPSITVVGVHSGSLNVSLSPYGNLPYSSSTTIQLQLTVNFPLRFGQDNGNVTITNVKALTEGFTIVNISPALPQTAANILDQGLAVTLQGPLGYVGGLAIEVDTN